MQDTYYNPVPHFGFDLAVRHSPNLWNIPVRPRGSSSRPSSVSGSSDDGTRDDDDLGPGLEALN